MSPKCWPLFLKRFSFYSKLSLFIFISSPVLYWNDPRVILSSHFSPLPVSLTHPNVFQENDLKVCFRNEDRFEGVIRRQEFNIFVREISIVTLVRWNRFWTFEKSSNHSEVSSRMDRKKYLLLNPSFFWIRTNDAAHPFLINQRNCSRRRFRVRTEDSSKEPDQTTDFFLVLFVEESNDGEVKQKKILWDKVIEFFFLVLVFETPICSLSSQDEETN